jgi:hypothetical protein
MELEKNLNDYKTKYIKKRESLNTLKEELKNYLIVINKLKDIIKNIFFHEALNKLVKIINKNNKNKIIK